METISDVGNRILGETGAVPGPEIVIPHVQTVCESNCPLCGGIGWLSSGITDIHHPNFGRLIRCPNVSLFKVYGKKTGLTEDEWGLTWDDLKERENIMDGIEAVYQAIYQRYGWVFLWGDYGLAKTIMLKIAAASSLRLQTPAVYVRMEEILDNLRAAFDVKSPSFESQRRLEWWVDLPMLCIDEFDKVYETEYAIRRRFLLMDHRYEAAISRKSITIIASNLAPEKFEGYLYDRIGDRRFAVVHLTGTSYRKIAR